MTGDHEPHDTADQRDSSLNEEPLSDKKELKHVRFTSEDMDENNSTCGDKDVEGENNVEHDVNDESLTNTEEGQSNIRGDSNDDYDSLSDGDSLGGKQLESKSKVFRPNL